MKILNLVYPEKSSIRYEKQSFPDGQQNIVINEHDTWEPGGVDKAIVTIKSRLNNWLDLELIVCTVKSLKELDIKEIHLYVPYFLGSRSDRKFEEGGNNYLKDVICPIINSLGFTSVTVLDPHSDVLEACLNGFRKESNKELVKWATRDIFGVISEKGPNSSYPCILVSPDTGANKKIYKLAEQIGYTGDIITCSKDRDENGKLTKCIVPDLGFEFNKDVIIIDDICDGGATFINIAKAINTQLEFHKSSGFKNNSKLYLIVTHGIFSKGFMELSKYFTGIYTTNSYKDLIAIEHTNHGRVKVEELVKQLNVF